GLIEVSGFRFQVSGFKHQAPSTKHQAPSTKHQASLLGTGNWKLIADSGRLTALLTPAAVE
ncbi:MAG: hypothetical protein RI637_09810, partial [Acidimicrobiia bacterium]|nr:hypothetical protein [Acidimicrobiia bacterium]